MLNQIAVLCLVLVSAAIPATTGARGDASHIARPEEHALGLAGAPNFRDLGGYRTMDGRTVRRGLVFRSSRLAPLTPDDWARVDQLRIGQVYDLRTAEERHAEPDPWPNRPRLVYESPKPDLKNMIAMMRKANGSASRMRAAIIAFYAQMPLIYATEYAALFKGLAAGRDATLIHCTAGKDRTGVASALLLTALGVPRRTVLDDYEMTERLAPPATAATISRSPISGVVPRVPPDVSRVMWRSDPAYVAASLDAVNRRYGGTDSYLRRELGLTPAEIRAIRSRLLS